MVFLVFHVTGILTKVYWEIEYFIVFILKFYFNFHYGLSVHTCMCNMCPQSSEEVVGSSGNGVTNSCESLDLGTSN